jgi:hypothetical protein
MTRRRSITEGRELLGAEADGLTDEQIEAERESMERIAAAMVDGMQQHVKKQRQAREERRRRALPGGTGMTRADVEQAAAVFVANERRRIWELCGTHAWRTLPTTTDTGDHYCPQCCSIFDATGALLNEPHKEEGRPA